MTDSFDFDQAANEAWAEFGGKLAEVLSVMDETEPLTIGAMVSDRRNRSPFVRFTADSDGTIFAEAASNPSLGEEFQLSAEELTQFADDGWQSPTASGDRPTECLWQLFAAEDVEELASDVVRAFRFIYGVAHPVFLDADELAEILVPQAPQGVLDDVGLVREQTEIAFWPQSVAELDERVRQLLIKKVGYEPLADSNGDRAIRVGSTAVFVRVIPDASEVLIYSPLVHEIEGRSRAVETLNDLNCEAKIGRFFLLKDRVFVSVAVFARPFIDAHFTQALRTMSVIADGIDDELAAKLRGRTTFDSHE